MINDKSTRRRFFVRKKNIINSLNDNSISIETILEKSLTKLNQNCCRNNLAQTRIQPTKDKILDRTDEFIVEIPKQTKSKEDTILNEKKTLLNEIFTNSWPSSSEYVENLIITNKRCQFSNEAISIKPITAVPGIGKKYGQLLADHGFIYARQLLGYYMMLKDNEIFRKWLEYRFHIPRFRAAETASALNELIRQML